MAQDLQNIESIFDFFYLDNPKIKSFYAQLNGLGSLNTLKSTSQIGDTRKLEATVGVPTVTGGKMGNDHTATTSSESAYDGIPTMPREMINRLDELGFINYKLEECQLGNLVLLKGKLGVVDVAGMKDIIDPAVEFGLNQEPDKNPSERTAKNKLKKNLTPFVTFVKGIPFALQARFFNDGNMDEEVWMTLSRAEMINSVHDLNFKHGDIMAGEWHVLGVLDAIPHDQEVKIKASTEINAVLEEFTKMMKEQFGRPASAFGMTPIAIFRILRSNQKYES